jgi:hypothetical protein
MVAEDESGSWYIEIHRVRKNHYLLKACASTNPNRALVRNCVRISASEAFVISLRHSISKKLFSDLKSSAPCLAGKRGILDATVREILDEQIARKLV